MLRMKNANCLGVASGMRSQQFFCLRFEMFDRRVKRQWLKL